MLYTVLIMAGAYLFGSIPFSHIFPKMGGKEVDKSGTKNIGATNALIVAGPFLGFLALLGDAGKGFLVFFIARQLTGLPAVAALAGICVVLGHDFSIFMKFRGGKGIAPTVGALLAMDFIFTAIILLLWLLLIVVTRYFIPSTLVALGLLPALMLVVGLRIEYVIMALVFFGLALFVHRRDIQRFISGKEFKADEAVKYYLGSE